MELFKATQDKTHPGQPHVLGNTQGIIRLGSKPKEIHGISHISLASWKAQGKTNLQRLSGVIYCVNTYRARPRWGCRVIPKQGHW